MPDAQERTPGQRVKKVTLIVDVEVDNDADADMLAEELLDFLCADPHDLFPMIKVVSGCEARSVHDLT